MGKSIISLFLIMCIAVPQYARGADIGIPSDYGTIQLAVGSASTVDGDTIIIEQDMPFGAASLLTITKRLNFTSTAPLSPYTLDLSGGANNRFSFAAGSNGSTIAGLILTGATGSATGGAVYNNAQTIGISSVVFATNTATTSGGAIYNAGGGTITVVSSQFNGNTASSSGGAIYNFTNGNVTVSSCSFDSNSAGSYGGAIYNTAGVITINGASGFTNNKITSASGTGGYCSGGAIYNTGATAGVIIDAPTGVSVIFSSNTATGTSVTSGGGAIYNGGGILTVNNDAIFLGNTASGNGGAIYGLAGAGAELKLSGKMLFDGNEAKLIGGGAIYNTIAGAAMNFSSGTIFTNNKASYASTAAGDGSGGAIYNSGANSTVNLIGTADNEIMFTSNTASGKSATSGGGAIYNNSASTITIAYTVFDGNTAGEHGGTIYNAGGGQITIDDATEFKNTSAGVNGGAIYNTGVNSSITLGKKVFDSITAGSSGGVICNVAGGLISLADDTQFTNNNVSTAAASYGGAIYSSGTAAAISDITMGDGLYFYNNQAYSDGGAIYNGAYSTIVIGDNSEFTANKVLAAAGLGGAIYNTGAGAGINIGTGTVFNNNSANSEGGAIYNSAGGSISLGAGAQFTDNSVSTAAASYGGAVYSIGAAATLSNFSMGNDVYFYNNRAYTSGGAIYNGTYSTIIIGDNAEFTGNSALAATGYGGAIYNTGGGAQINIGANAKFSGNSVETEGGAIYNAGAGIITIGAGSTFSVNVASVTTGSGFGTGGAIYNTGANSTILIDSATGASVIFSDNKAFGTSATSGGGAIYNTGGIVTINNDAQFLRNTAGGNGGAIYAVAGTGAQLNLSGKMLFDGNEAQLIGGAIYSSIVGASMNFSSGTIFNNNKAFTGSGGAIYNSGASTINLIGTSANPIMFTGNTASGATTSGGGAIYNTGASTITIVNTVFDGNTAGAYGGTIYNAAGGYITIDDGTEIKNTSAGISGGAIYNTGANSSITLGKKTFDGIIAVSSGGVIYNAAGGSISLADDTQFSNNSVSTAAVSYGGAVFSVGAAATISNITMGNGLNFYNNQAYTDGGAIYNGTYSQMTIGAGARFSMNTAFSTAGGSGGAIYNTGANSTIMIDSSTGASVIFSDNKALGTSGTSGGGAIYNNGGIVTINNDAQFLRNTAGGNGGAIYAVAGTGAQLNLSGKIIFDGNEAQLIGGGAIYNTIAGASLNFSAGTIFNNNKASSVATTANYGSGGAIYNAGAATLNLAGTPSNPIMFTGNTSSGTSTTSGGGAIYNSSVSTITIVNTVFDGNTAARNGGTIYNSNGIITIDEATAIKNSSAGFYGGAIFNSGTTASINIGVKIFDAITAGSDGGVIYNATGGSISLADNTQFTNNNVSTAAASYGGVIYSSGAAATVSSITMGDGQYFYNNQAYSGGGAIYNGTYSQMTIGAGATFSWNVALSTTGTALGSGGAIYNTGANAAITIDAATGASVIFSDNKAFGTSTTSGGGAIYNTGGIVTINNDAQFLRNTAVGNGGAIYAIAGTGAQLNLSGKMLFDGNEAQLIGGGAIYSTIAGSSMNFSAGTIFTNNKASYASTAAGDGSGGVIYNAGANSTINLIGTSVNPVKFTNNTSSGTSGTSGGGAIYNSGVSTITIVNTVFDGNTSAGNGGTIYNNNGIITIDEATTIANTSAGVSGGAIFNTGTTASLNIGVKTFDGITAGTSGGVIYNAGGGRIVLSAGTIFSANAALSTTTVAAIGSGGAIYNTGANSTIIIDSSTGTSVIFSDNKAFGSSTTSGGGAIYNTGGILTINNDAQFVRNTAGGNGGAIYAIAGAGAQLNLSGKMLFDGNEAQLIGGGAIYSTIVGAGMNFSSGTVFNNNSASSSATGAADGSGGAIYNGGANSTINLIGTADNQIMFTGNTASGKSTTSGGGAIYNTGASTVTIAYTVFDGNTAAEYGGTIYNAAGGHIIIDDATEIKNTSAGASGGAIFNTGANSLITLGKKTFDGITAGSSGGVIYNAAGGSISLADGTQFTNNSVSTAAASYGGAIYNTGAGAEIDISTGTVFNNNSAVTGGGAIYNTTAGIINIGAGATFSMNVALSTTAGSGGAIYNTAANSAVTIAGTATDKVRFSGNSAVNGGAIFNTGAATAVTTLSNTVFDQNTADLGGAIHNSAAGKVVINEGTEFINSLNTISATSYGGAIYNTGSASEVDITGAAGNEVNFTGLISNYGGAIANRMVTNNQIPILNINGNVIFSANTANVSGGAIYNYSGTVNMDSTLGDIVFSNNISSGVANDIYLQGASATYRAVLNVDGTANDVIIGSGISGNANSIINKTNDGRLLINADSSAYLGTFNQLGGRTIVSNVFFGTVNNIVTGGTLEFANGASFATGSQIKVGDGGTLEFSADTFTLNAGYVAGSSGTYGTIAKTGSGTLNITGNYSSFLGTFDQTGGLTVVTSAGSMFGGVNNISDATLQVTAASVNYNVNLGDNAVLNHYASIAINTDISSGNIVFTGTGAAADFGGDPALNFPADYTLLDKIDNGQANTVNFNDANVKTGSLDYTGATTYQFTNSTLDISPASTGTVVFGNLKSVNASLIAGGNFADNGGTYSLETGKLQVNETGSGSLILKALRLTGDIEGGIPGSVSATILDGITFVDQSPMSIGTNLNIYDVVFDAAKTGVALTFREAAAYNSLFVQNAAENTRSFNISTFDGVNPTVYNIGGSLSDTAAGDFYVMGYDSDAAHSVISGYIFEFPDVTTNRGSFFNLVNATNLTVSDLTFRDALIDGNGSVLRMNNADSTAVMTNVILTGNSSTNYGGAVDNEAGVLALDSAVFSSNTATGATAGGGAIHNAGADSQTDIANTLFDSNYGHYGGAILNEGGATLNIYEGTSFTNNNAASGGAIYNRNSGSVVYITGTRDNKVVFSGNVGSDIVNTDYAVMNIENAVFQNQPSGNVISNGSGATLNIGPGVSFLNNASTGYGAAISNGALLNIAGSADNKVVFDNNSITSTRGGALYLDATTTISNAVFTNNSSMSTNVNASGGGAIFMYNDAASFSITGGVLFQNNHSAGLGGAIVAHGVDLQMTTDLGDIDFIGNTAVQYGGAIADVYAYVFMNTTKGNINFTGNYAAGYGGAMYDQNGIYITADEGDVNFIQNEAAGGGGGAICTSGGSINITSNDGNVLFQGNEGSIYGGAIYGTNNITANNGAVTFDGNISLTSVGGAIYGTTNITADGGTVAFEGNISSSSAAGAVYGNINIMVSSGEVVFDGNSAFSSGGALYTTGASSIAGKTTFAGNTASTGNGGAIYAGSGSLTLDSSLGIITFSGNTAGGSGGAVYMNTGTLSADGILFNANAAQNGGAMYFSAGTVNIANTAFNGNTASSSGGALFMLSNAAVTLENVSFTGNTAGVSGGAVYMNAGSTLNINQTLTGIENAGKFEGNKAAGASNAIHMAGNSTLNFNLDQDAHFYLSDDVTCEGTGNTINLNGQGILHVTADPVTVNTNFFNTASGSKLELSVFSNGTNDKIISSDTDVLDGALNVQVGVGTYNQQVFHLIMASSISGDLIDDIQSGTLNLATVSEPNLTNFTYTYDATTDEILLTITGSSSSNFSSLPGMSYNQTQIARNLDTISSETTPGAFQDMINDSMFQSTDEQLSRLTQLSLYFLANLEMNSVINNYRPDLYAKIKSREGQAAGGADYKAWAQLTGNWTRLGTDSNSPYDFNSDAYGALFGVDRYFAENMLAGIYGKYTVTNATQGDDSGTVGSFSVGGYGGLIEGKYDIRVSLSVGINQYDTSRKIAFLGETAKADFSGVSSNADVEGGLKYQLTDLLALRPYAGISVSMLNYGSYSETGGGPAAVDISGGTYLRTLPRIGVELNGAYKIIHWYAGLQGQVLLTGKYLELDADFQQGPGLEFKNRSVTQDIFFYGAGLGGNIALGKNWSVSADCAYDMNSSFGSFKGNIGAKYSF